MEFDETDLKHAVNHLAFDVYHFRCYVRLHREGHLNSCPPTIAQAVRYALLLHLRLLLDFFYGPPKLDDCWVGHFRILPGFSESFPTTIDFPTRDEARALSVSLHKRLAHLTATRWKTHTRPMNYYDQYFEGIEKLIVAFESALPDDVRTVFADELRHWERHHPATIFSQQASAQTTDCE